MAMLLAVVTAAPPAHASEPVIERGREAAVLALFRPHVLTSEVTPGWRLWEVRIRSTFIEIELDGPGDGRAAVRLDHPDKVARPDMRSKSFAVTRSTTSPEGAAASAVLLDALTANDDGTFWQRAPVKLASGVGVQHLDGSALLVLLVGVVLALALRGAGGAPAVVAALGGIFAFGLAIRCALAPAVPLDPWPYSRLGDIPRLVFFGPIAGALSARIDSPIFLTDVVKYCTLTFSAIAPLAAFGSARALSGNVGVGLAAAAVFASLPHHARFAMSDSVLVASVTFSLVGLTVLWSALTDESARWRAAWTLALPLATFGALVSRPLDLLMAPLYAGATWWLTPGVPRVRKLVVTAALSAATAPAVYLQVVAHAATAREIVAPRMFVDGVAALVNPFQNALLDPRLTPPLLVIAAFFGGRHLWQTGQRRLLALLLGWLASFAIAHGVVPAGTAAMQARYHLHLIPPFVLLAAVSLEPLRRLGRRALVAAAVVLASAPFVHLSALRGTDFNDHHEWSFLLRLREKVPAECTVFEFVQVTHDARFPRIGHHLLHGEPRWRWFSVVAGADEEDPAAVAERVGHGLRDARGCAYFYEGLPCWSSKQPAEEIAPTCAQLSRMLPTYPVDSVTFTNHPYDTGFARGLSAERQTITLTLRRVDLERRGRGDAASPSERPGER